ncbi:trehalose-phosphatase [Desulforhopalus sp. IMCC35007]|uniref:trehalose-phosphatase n=1 Tax=Desulforhopalus sp. IMCC35007 TaxID=2569543 RepID=UPI0010AED620|nr:trehalose-phosphatase [Desulforhopalus sp. IMCC35007]TKB05963.1 trehalose-phosphatase [Desulforhopalus sp. IMCC35007]
MNTHHDTTLPSAIDNKDKIIERLCGGRPAIFLDYDGTLTPIVDDPAQAILDEKTRQLLKKLAAHWTVVIVSGRALDDVKKLVGLDSLGYVGSHGFNLLGPENSFHEKPGEIFLPVLDRGEKDLKAEVNGLEGVRIERKPFAIAVHFRQAADDIIPELEQRIDAVVGRHADLVKTVGKKIFELRPKADWDKGKALLYLLEKLYIDSSRAVPLYMGDNTTDEDAFRAIADRGIGILVSDHTRETAARYVLRDPHEVVLFLEELVRLCEKMASVNVWSLTYEGFEPDSEKLRETLCTTGNGYFATRGAAPEAEADSIHYPGTYVAGIYNRLKSKIGDHTIENESMVNVPNWLPLTFRIEDDNWFALESVEILEYRQELDMQHGVLVRVVLFEDDKKRRTRLTQRRFVHMRYPHLAGLETTILPVNWSGTLHVRSALDGRVKNTQVKRYRQLNTLHLNHLQSDGQTHLIWLEAETNQSHIRIAEAARTELFYKKEMIDPPREVLMEEGGYIAHQFCTAVKAGLPLRIEKIASLYTSRDAAVSDCLTEARTALSHAESFAQLLELHTLAWNHLWTRWRIDIRAQNPRIKRILNLHIFHLLQTVSPNSVDLDVGVPPRGLHGEAYRGLIMWDEIFIFPILNLRIPDITRALLKYRYRRIPHAHWAAKAAGYRGIMFPWQSGSDGREQVQTLHLNPESGRWIPDNTKLERHINIAIAYNTWQYYQVTGDMDFMSFYGAELMLRIARFWAAKTSYNESMGRYEIRKVMGPDEFHDRYPGSEETGIDNNAYTNVMVAWIFWRVLELLEILPGERRTFIMENHKVGQKELNSWYEIGHKLRIPFHGDGIISQFERYDQLKEFDWQGYLKKYNNIQRLDRILEAEGESPNDYKVSKQADVLMLFYLLSADELCRIFERLGYDFNPETIPDNVDYYLKRTAHGSTLSRVVHAWVLSRSKREMSWRLFQDALESDIEDIQGDTTHEGIHLGAMAGTVDLIMRCYSGIECRGDILIFSPRLPSELESVEFSIIYRRNWLDIKIDQDRIILYSRPHNEGSVKIGYAGTTQQLSPGDREVFDL